MAGTVQFRACLVLRDFGQCLRDGNPRSSHRRGCTIILCINDCKSVLGIMKNLEDYLLHPVDEAKQVRLSTHEIAEAIENVAQGSTQNQTMTFCCVSEYPISMVSCYRSEFNGEQS